jgi:hypothetical protein
MALTKDTPLEFLNGDFIDLPVVASGVIYEGSLVGIDAAGWAKALAITDIAFVGVAYRGVSNAGGANGAKFVKVRQKVDGGPMRVEVPVATATQAAVGDPVYATDDNTFTLVVGSNKLVGKCSHFISGTTCQVRLDPDV